MINDIVKIKFILEGYLPNYPYHLISEEEMLDAFLRCPDYSYTASSEDSLYDDICCSCKCCCCCNDSESVEFEFTEETWLKFLSDDHICYFKDRYPMLNFGCHPLNLHDYIASLYEKVDQEIELEDDEKQDWDINLKYKKLVEDMLYHIMKHVKDISRTYQIPDWIYSYMIDRVVTEESLQQDKHYLFTGLDRFFASHVDNPMDDYTNEARLHCYDLSEKWLRKLVDLDHRPPTIFGEPHVIKCLRLDELDVEAGDIV